MGSQPIYIVKLTQSLHMQHQPLTQCKLGTFPCFLVACCLVFHKNELSQNILSGIPSECQTVGSKLFAKVISRQSSCHVTVPELLVTVLLIVSVQA